MVLIWLTILRTDNERRVRDGYISESICGHGRPVATHTDCPVCRTNVPADDRRIRYYRPGLPCQGGRRTAAMRGRLPEHWLESSRSASALAGREESGAGWASNYRVTTVWRRPSGSPTLLTMLRRPTAAAAARDCDAAATSDRARPDRQRGSAPATSRPCACRNPQPPLPARASNPAQARAGRSTTDYADRSDY